MSLAGSFAGMSLRAAAAAVAACAGTGDLVLQGGDGRVLDGGSDGRVREQPGQLPFCAGEGLLRVADGGGGGLAGRVIHDLGVRLDAGEVVADLVDPVVLAGVLQEVLLPPPGLQPGQDVRRARLKVGGEDLQGDPAVLEQRDLPGLPVVLDLHGLLGPGDLPGPAAVCDRGDDRQHDRDGQRCPPVGHPVHVLAAAVREDLRVGAAPVEPEHDPRAGPGGFPQLGQRLGQRDAEPGGFPGHEAHRPAVMRGDMGIGAAPLSAAPLVIPALLPPAWPRYRARNGHRRSTRRRSPGPQ